MTHLVYGELTYNGVKELLKNININESDTFVDVGSGYGKLLETINHIYGCKVIGIEIDKHRYEISKEIIQIKNKNKLELFHGNFMDLHRVVKSGNIVFSNCVAFPPEWVEIMWNMCYKTFIHNNKRWSRQGTKLELEVTYWPTKHPYYILEK